MVTENIIINVSKFINCLIESGTLNSEQVESILKLPVNERILACSKIDYTDLNEKVTDALFCSGNDLFLEYFTNVKKLYFPTRPEIEYEGKYSVNSLVVKSPTSELELKNLPFIHAILNGYPIDHVLQWGESPSRAQLVKDLAIYKKEVNDIIELLQKLEKFKIMAITSRKYYEPLKHVMGLNYPDHLNLLTDHEISTGGRIKFYITYNKDSVPIYSIAKDIHFAFMCDGGFICKKQSLENKTTFLIGSKLDDIPSYIRTEFLCAPYKDILDSQLNNVLVCPWH